MGFLPLPTPDELDPDAAALAAAHEASHGALSPLDLTLLGSAVAFEAYRGWFPLRDEIEPFLGTRAVALFSYAIARAGGYAFPAAYFRGVLTAEGDDPDAPQVTEAEQTLIDFGAAIGAGTGVDDALRARVASTFQPRLRLLLTAFAGQAVAVGVVTSIAELDAPVAG